MTDKRKYYEKAGVVSRYDGWRFGSAGGRYVDSEESDAVLAAVEPLPRHARVLDLPVGTGRLTERLQAVGFERVFCADASAPMLASARARCGPRPVLSRHDAFMLGFKDASFDGVICLRFLFHYHRLSGVLSEIARILKPGGVAVFDTLRWSPRAVLPYAQVPFGGLVYPRRDSSVEAAIVEAGLRCVSYSRILLLPSLAYRFLPRRGIELVRRLEKTMPERCRTKTIWTAMRCA